MKNRDFGLLVLRLTIGLLMLPHGINKLLHADAFGYVQSTLVAKGLPNFIAYGVYLSEIIAPIMIVLGFRTRLAALIMVLGGISTLFLAYGGQITAVTAHGGWAPELPGLFLFGALALFFTGSGKHAISTRHKWD